MDNFLNRFNNMIKGTIKGFDRIIFKGILKPIIYNEGMQNFLRSQGVLNKNYKDWVKVQSKKIVETAQLYTKKQIDGTITYIPSCNQRKETIAHDRQNELDIKSGLIGVWSCLESCSTYKSTFNDKSSIPLIKKKQSRCKHLYFYYDHIDYGFMSVRLQTWAPYDIQIALNGREWLRRILDKEKCSYIIEGNKFLDIADYNLAQNSLYKQLDTQWVKTLNGFIHKVLPPLPQFNYPYYWTVWQSEWAKDYIFKDTESLNPVMDDLLYYALITGNSENVLRYMEHLTGNGKLSSRSNPEVMTRIKQWNDGVRVRHWAYQNSLKAYNEKNVLRFEMTMNNPSKYRAFRHKEGFKEGDPRFLLPLRKGIADINLRAQISDNKLNNFINHMAALKDRNPVKDLFSPVVTPFVRKGKKIRSLDITGKDKPLLLAISDPLFDVDYITNKALQKKLIASDWAKGKSGKKLSARISRNIRLLRDHALIRKVPGQRKYLLTEKGKKITAALNAALSACTEELLKLKLPA